MAKKLNVDLVFNADVKQAKRAMAELQSGLTSLSGSMLDTSKTKKQIKELGPTINDLKANLSSAFNADTGRLDLSKFNQQMKASGQSLIKYKDALLACGPAGVQAFTQLSRAISQADVPLFNLNKKFRELGTVMANTVKWQLSSSMIHGFMGAVQKATSYVENLNENLVNIQIVTGMSSQEMEKFAVQANNAAQALSTTTNAYAKASLIYFQQGLNYNEVIERTDATIKMAAVTGDAVDQVSSYLTAIWNNFDDGSESLEHYADVLAALGAATASDASEISNGMQKFASIAETVGLSYEYAASALTTIVSVTRQSEDTVGTALKTIFARFQDLELGEEGSVSIGKYSQALAQVGINVLDANGNMLQMNDILDQMGEKWNTLSQAQQVALAQNVAGQRQYAQLMALMSNWSDFQNNINISNNADGALDEQFAFYEDSIDAAKKRMQSAMEEIYNDILDDDWFKNFYDGMAKITNVIDDLIKGLGGLPGVLTTVAAAMTKAFGPEIENRIRKMIGDVSALTPKARAEAYLLKEQSKDLFIDSMTSMGTTKGNSAEAVRARGEAKLQNAIMTSGIDLNEVQQSQLQAIKERANYFLELQEAQDKVVEAAEQELAVAKQKTEELQAQKELLEQQSEIEFMNATGYSHQEIEEYKSNKEHNQKYKDSESYIETLVSSAWEGVNDGAGINRTAIANQLENLNNEGHILKETYDEIKKLLFSNISDDNLIDEIEKKAEEAHNASVKVNNDIENIISVLDDKGEEVADEVVAKIKTADKVYQAVASKINKVTEAIGKSKTNTEAKEKTYEEELKKRDEIKSAATGVYTQGIDLISGWGENGNDIANKITTTTQALTGLTSAYYQTTGAIDAFKSAGEGSISYLEAAIRTIPLLTTASMKLVSSYSKITTIATKLYGASKEGTAITKAMTLATKLESKELGEKAIRKIENVEAQNLLNDAKKQGIEVTNEMTVAELKNALQAKFTAESTKKLGEAFKKFWAEQILPMLALAAAYGAVVLALKAFKKLTTDNYEKNHAKTIEEQAKSVSELKNAYAEAKDYAQQFKDTLSGYNDLVEILSKCTYGTQEWRDALQEVNDKAKEMIEMYPELSQYAKIDYQNGQIVISNANVMSDILDSRELALQNAALVAQSLSENYRITETVDEVSTLLNSENKEAINEFRESGRAQEISDSYHNYVQSQYSEGLVFANNNFANEGYSDSTMRYIASMYSDAIDSTSGRRNLAWYADAESLLSNFSLSDIVGGDALRSSDVDDEYREALEGNVEAYNTAMNTAYDFAGIVEEDGNYFYRLMDAQGEIIKVSVQQAEAICAQQQAVEQLGVAASWAAEKLEELSTTEERDFVMNVASKNYEAAFADTDAGLRGENILNAFTGNARQAIAEILGITLTQADDLIKTEYLKLVESLPTVSYSAGSTIGEISSAVTLKQVANTRTEEAGLGFVYTTINRNSFLGEDGKGLDPERLAEYYERFNEIDLYAYDAADQIHALNEEFDNICSASSEFEESVRSLDHVFDLSATSATDFGAKLESAISKLDTGDVLDSDKYGQLIEYLGDGMAEYFQITETGQYRLISTAEEFNNAVRDAKAARFDEIFTTWTNAQSELGITDGVINNSTLLTELKTGNYQGIEWGEQSDLYNSILYGEKTTLTQEEAQALVTQMEQYIGSIETIKAQLYDTFEDAMMNGIGEESREELAEYFTQVEAAAEGLDPEVVEDYVDELQEMYPALEQDAEAAHRIALANARFNEGMKTLTKNSEDWFAVLNTGDRTLQDYSLYMSQLKNSMEDIFDVESDLISDNFVEDHLSELQEAATGDIDAIDALSVALAQDIAQGAIDGTKASESELAIFNTYLENFDPAAIEVGAELDDTHFMAVLNNLLKSGAITADNLQQMMSALGWEVKIDEKNGIASVVGASYRGSASQRGYNPSSSGKSSGGSKDTKDEKKLKDEAERYHVINNQLEDMAELLNEISTIKDSAYGPAKLRAMQKEIELAKEELALGEEKLRQIEEYYKQDQAIMRGYGATFDENGTITNYDALVQQQLDKYNAAVRAYNASAQSEKDKAVMEAAEKDYEIFTNALKTYEETADLWFDQYNDNLKKRLELLEKELEEIEYSVKIQVEIEDEDIKMIEFLLKGIEDDAYSAAEAIALLGKAAQDNINKYEANKQGLAQVLATNGINGEDAINRIMNGENMTDILGTDWTESQMEAIEKYIEGMMSAVTDGEEEINKAFEKVKDVYDENNKQFEDLNSRVAHSQKMLKSYQNITDIVGRKTLGINNATLRGWNDSAAGMANDRLGVAASQKEAAAAELESVRASYAAATTEEEKKKWKELLDYQESEYMKIEENFQSAWEEALTAAREAFSKNVDSIIEDFNESLGYDTAMFEKNLEKTTKDLFEPDYERIYQLSNLLDDIGDSISNTKNTSVLNSLVELQQEIVDLQEEGKELSEYDLKYLRLRYEAKMAEAALEDAQNAKTEVRMSRDNEGNYSYIYTANQDEVDKAEDNYRQKIYEMEKANQEYVDKLENNMASIMEEVKKQLAEAEEIYGAGTAAYEEAAEKIFEQAGVRWGVYKDQMNNVFKNNQRLYDEDIESYARYTGDYYSKNVDLTTNTSKLYIKMGDELDKFYKEEFLPSLQNSFKSVINENEKLAIIEDKVMKTAGASVESYGKTANAEINKLDASTNTAKKDAEQFGKESVTAYNSAKDAVQKYVKEALDKLAQLRSSLSDICTGWKNFASSVDTATAALERYGQQSGSTTTSNTVATWNDGGGSSYSQGTNSSRGASNTINLPTVSQGEVIKQITNVLKNRGTKTNEEAYGKMLSVAQEDGKWKSGFVANAFNAKDEEKINSLLEKVDSSLLKELYKAATSTNSKVNFSFDTGGYTGAWGTEGRLAFLHQKELVLNASDTENILSAVKGIREISQAIDLNALSSGAIPYGIGNVKGNGQFEQSVTISANFPNVTEKSEIEAAFDNLINKAAQYANRKI